MSLKKWNFNPVDKELAIVLAKECSIDAFCALLLSCKGITDPTQVLEFLSDECFLPSPYEFADMEKGVKRVRTAIENNEKIAIFGDYDADGVTSTALTYSVLKELNANVFYRLPTRDEGYGINSQIIDELKEAGTNLIITVDNGITATESIDYANKAGIDVVITDHHLPTEQLPNAFAVIDPKREDCFTEFKDYSGVGVAFMFCCALTDCSPEELILRYGDLVTVGTIADVMPLTLENRTIVKQGLALMQQGDRVGINALLKVASIKQDCVNSSSISFGIAPRLNAIGRISNPQKAVELLLCEDENEALELANILNDANEERKKQESVIFEEALEIIRRNPRIIYSPVMIICKENWHGGVIGIVAAKITAKFGKPCIVLSSDGEMTHGSARSYKGVSIHKIISHCSHLLEKCGGHETAAGISLKTKQIEKVINAIHEVALALYPSLPFDQININCKLNPFNISLANIYSQQKLEPFGHANEKPVFGLFNMRLEKICPVANGKHLRLTLARDNKKMTAMFFFRTTDDFSVPIGTKLDLAVTLDINNFMGNEEVSVIIKAIRPSSLEHDSILESIRAYEVYAFTKAVPMVKITRDDIAQVYKQIRTHKVLSGHEDVICAIFKTKDYLKLRITLDILTELELIKLCDCGLIRIEIIENAIKRDLTDSTIFMQFN